MYNVPARKPRFVSSSVVVWVACVYQLKTPARSRSPAGERSGATHTPGVPTEKRSMGRAGAGRAGTSLRRMSTSFGCSSENRSPIATTPPVRAAAVAHARCWSGVSLPPAVPLKYTGPGSSVQKGGR